MIERWKKAFYQKRYVGAVLTHLSKAFDCLNHQILTAKLEACGLKKPNINSKVRGTCGLKKEALSFIYDYLPKRN